VCHMSAGTFSIPGLAAAIGANMGRQVIDRTGLTGTYFVVLKWASDTSPDSSLPSLPALLKEQLGLELKADNGPVDMLVVDHVEHPTAD
jgi:uncharacterized protein (TIGR03435 family)